MRSDKGTSDGFGYFRGWWGNTGSGWVGIDKDGLTIEVSDVVATVAGVSAISCD